MTTLVQTKETGKCGYAINHCLLIPRSLFLIFIQGSMDSVTGPVAIRTYQNNDVSHADIWKYVTKHTKKVS